MHIFKCLFVVVTAFSSVAVFAGEDVLFQPVPDWVEQADLEKIRSGNKDSKAVIVLLDRQFKIEDGENWTYFDVALRMVSADSLPRFSQFLQASWHPDQGDLIVHRFEIHRDGKRINILDQDSVFEVIRRERNLERQFLNGILTAITQLKDSQIGDIIRFTFSTTNRNPVLEGRAEISSGFRNDALLADMGQVRLLWPKNEKLNWKISVDGVAHKLTHKGRFNDLRMGLFLPAQPKMPVRTPWRYKLPPFLAASGFDSWQDVSKVAAVQYQTSGLIKDGDPLAAEIAAIAGASADPLERTAMALRLVQDKVRYLFNGLGYGNYKPQSPSETWQLRYGDCKAKTLLLLAILHELDIEALPLLVNANRKDATIRRLPSFSAFDHIIVKAKIGDDILWLDGTGQGARIYDLKDAPAHRYGLPVTADGADLEEIPIRKAGRPLQDVFLTYDLPGGRALPALFDLRLVLRDSDARKLKAVRSVFSEEKFQETLNHVVAKYVVGDLVLESVFFFDEERSEAVVEARGISYLDWQQKRGRQSHEIGSVIDRIGIAYSRKKPEWQEIPVTVNYPQFFRKNTIFKLPKLERGYELLGNNDIRETFGGIEFLRDASLTDGNVQFSESYSTVQWEIAANQVEIERKKLSTIKRKAASIALPKDHLEKWREVKAAKISGKLKPLQDAFDELVNSAEVDDDKPFRQRAYFYQILGNYEKAADDLEAALVIKPDAGVYQRRSSLLVVDDQQGAIKSLEKSLALNSVHFSSVLALVRIYLEEEAAEKAEKVIEKASSKGLDDVKVDRLRVEVLQAKGRPDQAIALLTALIDEYPDNTRLLNERCWLRALENRELEAALEDCTTAIILARNPANILDSRALVYWRMGRYEEALTDLNRALRINPDLAPSYFLRAIVHKTLGNMNQSKSDLEASRFHYKYAGRYLKRFGISY